MNRLYLLSAISAALRDTMLCVLRPELPPPHSGTRMENHNDENRRQNTLHLLHGKVTDQPRASNPKK